MAKIKKVPPKESQQIAKLTIDDPEMLKNALSLGPAGQRASWAANPENAKQIVALSTSGFMNDVLFERVKKASDKLKSQGVDISILDYVLKHNEYLTSPFRTTIFLTFVQELENYVSGKECNPLPMLELIYELKDHEYSDKAYKDELKKATDCKIIASLEKDIINCNLLQYLFMVDKLWLDGKCNKEKAVKKIWGEHKNEIMAIDPKPYQPIPPDFNADEILKKAKERFSKMTEGIFKERFEEYISHFRTNGGQTPIGRILSPPKKYKTGKDGKKS